MLQFIVARVVLCYGTGKRALYQSNSPLVFYARNISQFLRFALRDVKAIKWLSSQRAACRQPEYEWFVCQSEHERQLLVVHGVCGECLEPEPELGADGCEPERQRSGQRLLCPLPKGLVVPVLCVRVLNNFSTISFRHITVPERINARARAFWRSKLSTSGIFLSCIGKL